MDKTDYIKKIVIGGFLLALGIVLPMAFHLTGVGGKVFLPMHIPVILGGFLLPVPLACLLGMVTPILSSFLTGMPKLIPMGIIMLVELGLYGLSISVFYRKLKLPSIVSLVLGMLVGRLGIALVVYILASVFGMDLLGPWAFVMGGLVTGLPGVALQLVLVPTIIYAVNKYTTINIDW